MAGFRRHGHICILHRCNLFAFLDLSLTGAQEFIEECNITNSFDHPNVLSLIGVSIHPEKSIPLMIMPFMQNGDVKSFVKSKRGGSIEFDCFPEVHTYKLNTCNYVLLCIYACS